MDQIAELLECAVCLDRFKEPKMLPCQHTFCLRPCLQNIVINNSVRCPECRACHILPRNGVEGLPTNLMAVRFLDRSDHQKENRQCKECKIENGDVENCNHCDESLCQTCIASHTRGLQKDLRNSLTQVRRIVPKLADWDSELRERVKKLEENGRNVKCKILQSIERFVSELQSRKKYLLEEVDALVASKTGSLQRQQGELEVKLAALTTHCQVANEICEKDLSLEGSCEIQQIQNEILCLAQQGRELVQSNGVSPDKVREAIKFTNVDENSVLSAISDFGNVASQPTLASESTPYGDTRGANNVPRTAERQQPPHTPRNQKVVSSVPQPRDSPWSRVAPTAPPAPATDSSSSLAEAMLRYRNEGRVKKCFGTFGNESGRMARWHDQNNVSRTTERQQSPHVPRNQTAVSHMTRPNDSRSSRVAPIAHPAAETNSSSRVIEALLRYGNKGQVEKYFGKEGSGGWWKLFHENSAWLQYPRGICSTASDNLVVADHFNHRIQIFDVNGRVKGSFGSEGKAEGQFDGVADVCVTSRGRIVASDYDRIQIFDDEGKFVRQFGGKGSGDGILSCPVGVATDGKGLIYVCDAVNRRVQVFSEEGKFVRKFGSENFSLGPSFLSVTSNGRVVVSDGNHRVRVFDSHGRHLFQFGSEGRNQGQFKSPRGVATDDHGNIIVCDALNNRVQIFTSDGDFVTSFGRLGSEPGQMNEPKGVCVLSDGRIAVCDCGNHRVQIF